MLPSRRRFDGFDGRPTSGRRQRPGGQEAVTRNPGERPMKNDHLDDLDDLDDLDVPQFEEILSLEVDFEGA